MADAIETPKHYVVLKAAYFPVVEASELYDQGFRLVATTSGGDFENEYIFERVYNITITQPGVNVPVPVYPTYNPPPTNPYYSPNVCGG